MNAASSSLTPQLQGALNATVSGYLGNNFNFASPANPPPAQSRQLSPQLLGQLQSTMVSAFNKSWSIPRVTVSLNPSELHFLQTCTVEQICSQPTNTTNPLVRFCLQVFTSALTQVTVAGIKTLWHEQKQEQKQERQVAQRSTPTNQEENRNLAHDQAAAKAAPVQQKHDVATQKANDAQNSPQSESVNKPTVSTNETTPGRDPSLQTMKKIATTDISRRIEASVTKQIKNHIEELGEQASIDRGYQALGQGKSMAEAGRIYQEASEANKAFIDHAGKTIGAAFKAGQFFNKVEEIGWQGAMAETIKSSTISFVSKHGANLVTTMVGCTNPVWCANVVRTIISDALVPQETAPPNHDMYPPLPPSSLQDLTRSRMPRLDPLYPTLRSDK